MKLATLLVLPALASIVTPLHGGAPVRPVYDWNYYDAGEPQVQQIALGRLLFFDKILSGNRNISCATCHHPSTETGDGLSLSIGEGGEGLGPLRHTGYGDAAIAERVPRNAPALFNLGALEFRRLFHDGRVEVDGSEPSGFRSPAGDDLPPGLDNVLAVQAMFPVTSVAEMAGQPHENDVGRAAQHDRRAGAQGVWAQLVDRLRAIPEYAVRFRVAFDDVDDERDISFVHAANAIAAFEAQAFRADRSPFDRYLRGERSSMNLSAERGMRLFYGKAGCSGCHGGLFQTDHEFHAIGMPQVGPGKGDGRDGREDYGRERVTGVRSDRHRFRTPSLRNVALGGPWGHDGAFRTLEGVVRHHLDPVTSLERYDATQALLPSRPDLDALDRVVVSDADCVASIAQANELPSNRLTERQLADLLEFLGALTDPTSLKLRSDVPDRVPSGLPVRD